MSVVKTYWATALVTVAVLVLSLHSGDGLPRVQLSIPYLDKWVHMIMYLTLSAVFTANLHRGGVRPLRTAIICLLYCIALGGIIELIQPYFPPRSCDVWDWVADIVGTLVGYTLIALPCRLRR